ncbi:MAG: bifunctional diaminohydroxyphosphoribosylaminopyrimidine deaminase/5-amino-6-(5-phosphoribosylamino)uracil reductase RibD [Alcaligenaceae bacterium]|nr:bifunctional diaminohydroxyphosphoribosylaminopyrimidine deaminase/5-amino-6-(5-phosphoribosylamino)uracil reductase RibD [Alcaligenaceae bacterium]
MSTDHAVFSTDDRHWMEQALGLATQSLYLTHPNPRVGCVLVRDGQLLASGATQQAGGHHAEAAALADARARGVSVKDATAYVTLEPCSHFGRTPPCADALLAAGVSRVVVGLGDPNPLVAGAGIARLRAAGLRVDVGLCAEASLALNPGFVSRMTCGRPWLWLKTAGSLDGRTALSDGRSQWITGEAARADGHHWRARSSLVLSGIGTVTADDPLLDVRAVQTPRQPLRAVLDTHLRIDEGARLFNGDPVWIFTVTDAPEKARRLADKNGQVIQLPAGTDGRIDLPAMLAWLGAHDINDVHVEAGARLNGALLQADAVDEWISYVAPRVLGDGAGLVQWMPPADELAQAPRFEFMDAVQLGFDMRLRLRHTRRWQALLRAAPA